MPTNDEREEQRRRVEQLRRQTIPSYQPTPKPTPQPKPNTGIPVMAPVYSQSQTHPAANPLAWQGLDSGVKPPIPLEYEGSFPPAHITDYARPEPSQAPAPPVPARKTFPIYYNANPSMTGAMTPGVYQRTWIPAYGTDDLTRGTVGYTANPNMPGLMTPGNYKRTALFDPTAPAPRTTTYSPPRPGTAGTAFDYASDLVGGGWWAGGFPDYSGFGFGGRGYYYPDGDGGYSQQQPNLNYGLVNWRF